MSRYPGITDPLPTLGSLHTTVLELKQVVEMLAQQRGNKLDHSVTFQDLVDRGIITPAQVETDDNQAANDIANLNTSVSDIESAIAALQAFDAALFPVQIDEGGTGQTTAAAAFSALKQAATTSATGVVELATDAEVLTGTDTARVSPISSLVEHNGVAKAWGLIQGSDGAILDSYGISNSARNSAGNYTLTLSQTMVNGSYVVVATLNKAASDEVITVLNKTTTTFDITINDVSAGAEDNDFSFAVFGELA